MRYRFMSICMVTAMLLTPAFLLAEVNQQAIDDVAAGKIETARASWWGFDPEDSTKALQAAINSGAPKVIVDNVGRPWIVTPIELAGNQEVIFEKGVEVVAKKGEFKGTNDCLFRAVLKENITLTGYGAVLRMQRSDYAGPEYKKAEWRHVLQFKSCTNIRVLGLTLTESGGDGIYLGTGKPGVTNKGVLIKDVICEKNYRQGISVITAEDLLIENCILRDTGGTAPQAGIDYEPNDPSERLVNCVMRDCVAEGNLGGGYVAYLNALNATSEPVSLRFENCKASNNGGTEAYVSTGGTAETAVKGLVEFVGCVFEPTKFPGIIVAGKPADTCRMRFERCALREAATVVPGQAPIALMTRQDMTDPAGGIEFVDCVVPEAPDRKPIALVDMTGGIPVKDVTGKLILERDGQRREVPITGETLAEWIPAVAINAIPRISTAGMTLRPVVDTPEWKPDALAFVRLRRIARLVIFAREGEQVSFRIRYLQVAHYSGNLLLIIATDWSGNEVYRTQALFNEETEVMFTAPATGLYRVAADPGLNYVQIPLSSHPINLSGETQPVHFYSTTGELYFWVPAGTTEFGVRVMGEGLGEAVRAALVDPTGTVVEEKDNLAQMYQFTVELPKPSPGEAWSLRLAKPSALVMEDHYVDLRGIPSLLAPAKDALLRP